jgi:hypothetical protein
MPDRNGDRADPPLFKRGDPVIEILSRRRGIVLERCAFPDLYWVRLPASRVWPERQLRHRDELEPDM